jgi:TRAP-type transport system periplasmic protein
MPLGKLLISAGCALALLVGHAPAQPEIKLAHSGAPGSVIDLSAQEFARLANERLADRAEVVVYGQGQLGSDFEALIKLRLGTVDLALPGTVMSTEVPAFGLFEMPYLVRDREHMARIRDEIVKPILAPLAAERGYRIIGVWENGFRHITSSKRPVVEPDDLQGIKLRVPEGAWRVKLFESLGASPTPLPFSEVYVALQSGVVDGQENPLAIIHSAHLYEVQRYLSLSGHVYSPVYLTAGASWARLDPDVQDVLVEVAAEVEPVSLQMGAELDDELLAKLMAAGMQVNEVDRGAFLKASGRVFRAFAAEVPEGGRLIELAAALADEF